MRVTLCLLCVSACLTGSLAAPLATPRKAEAAAASQDEVSVLMYGVLQFSQSFHEIYQSTEAKIARITESLRSHELALHGLSQDAVQAAGREVHIRGALGLLEAQMAELYTQAEQTKGKLAHVEQEEEELKKKVANLETNLKNSTLIRLQELQERAVNHSALLKTLEKWNKRQRQNLELQNRKLTRLQRAGAAQSRARI
ncbi:angiopoietin-like protein 8 isoform X2 [Osmerus mordax]|uniref:angiopoietin-like protein 8 isoform X2 n=1 Tax=Osmerus mordax TaxID=8014 RepID=UPI00350FFE26